jgi:UDP-glucose 4-epimerase
VKEVLVVDGAGYIGSHMVKMLAKSGFDVTVFDNLSTGYKSYSATRHIIKTDPRQMVRPHNASSSIIPEKAESKPLGQVVSTMQKNENTRVE